MDPALISEVVTVATTTVVSLARIGQRRKAQRDKARIALAQTLPAGSRIVDRGHRGVLIEVGSHTCPEENRAIRE